MINALKSWKGPVVINGTRYEAVADAMAKICTLSGEIHVELLPRRSERVPVRQADASEIVRITVKPYMLKKATPEFDFMKKWNNDNPMPLRTMIGTVVKETRGMVYMKLHGDIYADKICTCMKCGRVLTNPVSQYFGIGPECGGHNYIHPFNTDAELREAVAKYRAELQSLTWEGWIIKSAIIEQKGV